MKNYTRQQGITLLEMIVALGILAATVVGVSTLVDQNITSTKLSVSAQHMRTVGEAARAYIKDNYAAVQSVATATTPALITVSSLVSTGYLPTGFSAANNYNQNVCVLVLEPSANQLNGLVVAEGGTSLDDLSLGQLAATIGAAGGGMYSTDTTNARGAMGGWLLEKASYGNTNSAGVKCDGSTSGAVSLGTGRPVMALWFADVDSTTAYLHRSAVSGRPELNTMNTPIIMANTQVQASACTTTGAISRDASGAVLSCQGGTWQAQGSSYWKDPVENIAALNAITCNASISGQTRVVTTPTVGTGPRGYTCTGSAWMPLGIDDSGNIVVAGTATLDKLAGNLQIVSTAAENAACTGEGRIASSSTTSGLILSCQSGVWATVPTLGRGQTWQDVTASRVMGATYTNPTPTPILANVSAGGGGNSDGWSLFQCWVDGVRVGYHRTTNSNSDSDRHWTSHSFVVPSGSSYTCTLSGTSSLSLASWAELR